MNDVHAPDKVRCRHCGGLNPLDARWCGQCLERFDAPAPPPPPEAAPEAPAEGPGPGAPPQPAATGAITPGIQKGSFRSTEEGILWTCSACEAENPLMEPACRVCGTAFAETMKPPPKRNTGRDPGTVALVSLFFPGAGHAYLGLWPQAVARAVVSIWVGLMASFFAVGAKGGSMAFGVMFAMIAFSLWIVAAHDAYREASDEPKQVLLHGRRFTFLVLGLLVLLLSSMFLTTLTNR